MKLLEFELFAIGDYSLHAYHLFSVFLIVMVTWLLLKVIRRVLSRKAKNKNFDEGRAHALFQLTKYFLVILAIVIGLQVIGVQVTILIAGSAAILVGLGFGIQQIFNDIVSGIILLFEGTVSVGDVVEIDSVVGKVEKIDLRTSKIETRDDITIVVPNSKLVSDNVINWSHSTESTRFCVAVGVAYGSNVKLVMKILKDCALANADVCTDMPVVVRFNDFGESSLDFQLFFYCINMFGVEQTKSDLRIAIDDQFRLNNVTIPFPQRDVHMIKD